MALDFDCFRTIVVNYTQKQAKDCPNFVSKTEFEFQGTLPWTCTLKKVILRFRDPCVQQKFPENFRQFRAEQSAGQECAPNEHSRIYRQRRMRFKPIKRRLFC